MGELLVQYPKPPTHTCPGDGTGVSWDTPGILPFSRVLQDEDYFSIGSPGVEEIWRGH